MILQYFLGMLLLVFAIASIIAGIFTAYFGSGRSKAIGIILILIGLIVGIIFLWGAGLLNAVLGVPPAIINLVGTVTAGVASVIGAIIGALLALGIFLVAIMKA
ncbi:MAG: hypothetical protein DRN12_00485 [Thermoplasmata archaeon]|nr:MAG: hypothetical protein DRN12_00485 [Thermoplasmata archaeon]